MNKEDISHWQDLIMTTATEVGIKVLAARLDGADAKALRDALDQIVQNLVDNAEKYGRSADDRTIHVSARRLPAGATLVVDIIMTMLRRRARRQPDAKPGRGEDQADVREE